MQIARGIEMLEISSVILGNLHLSFDPEEALNHCKS